MRENRGNKFYGVFNDVYPQKIQQLMKSFMISKEFIFNLNEDKFIIMVKLYF